MGVYRIGPKDAVIQSKASGSIQSIPQQEESLSEHPEHTWLREQAAFLQKQLLEIQPEVIETVKHIQVEVPVEVIKYVDREIHSVTEFPVFKEKIIKEFVEIPKEVIKEIEREVRVEVKLMPLWGYVALLVQTALIVALLLK